MAKIDNDKMWESLIRISKDGENLIGAGEVIIALKDQGLYWNGKEIVSVEPESFEIKKGNWYMCIKDETVNHYTKGKLYQSQSDCTLPNDLGEDELVWESIFDADSLDLKEYFRPATEEEISKVNTISQSPCFDCNMKGTSTCLPNCSKYKMFQNMLNTESNAGECYFHPATEEEIPQGPEQENTLKGAVEARKEIITCAEDFQKQKNSDSELNEFEQAIYKLYNIADVNCSAKDVIKKHSKEILTIARKQLQPEIDAEIEKAYKNQDEVMYQRGYGKGKEEAIRNIEQYIKEVPDKVVPEDYMTALRELLQHIKGEKYVK